MSDTTAGQPPAGAGLGLEIGAVPEALRAHLGLANAGGAMVTAVRGGAGEKAGIKKFDVLLALDGDAIGSASGLAKLLAARQPETPATLRLITAARSVELAVTLGASDPRAPAVPTRPAGPDDWAFPGMPRDLQRELRNGMEAFGGFAGGGGPSGGDFAGSSSFAEAGGKGTVALSGADGKLRLHLDGADAAGQDVAFTAKGTLAEVRLAVQAAPELPAAFRTQALNALQRQFGRQ